MIQRSSIGKSTQIERRRLVFSQIHEREPRGVPEFIGEIAAQLESLGRIYHAAVGKLHRLNRDPQVLGFGCASRERVTAVRRRREFR